jgi:cysteine desulfurase family protein (TIGR01976 family)
MTLDTSTIRSQFPALENEIIYLDNPAGTQVAQPVLDRVNRYLVETNANRGAAFETSRASDAILDEAHAACADFFNASRPEETVFGPNMTTLTYGLSRSIGRIVETGDTLVVTHLDHDANIAPWMQMAADRGAQVEWVDFDVEDGRLRLDSLERALDNKPKLVAVGYASNALGTINPVKQITQMAHDAGALVYIDAVQYAPHGPIDVQDIDCDFLVASAYKFFSTHEGVLYGRYDLLEELEAYKVRPAPKVPPGKFETGTQNHEGIAGVLGAMEYLEWLGSTYGQAYVDKYGAKFAGRRLRLKQAMAAIRAYEFEINRRMLETLTNTPGVRLFGPQDPRRLEERVPTFSFTMGGKSPRQVAERFGDAGIQVWEGNYYALAVTERLRVEESGGMVRAGAVHYNTVEEIARFGDVLEEIVRT